ncbi:MAG: hypothetical protein WD403_12070, partial [Pirellulales bacterium]
CRFIGSLTLSKKFRSRIRQNSGGLRSTRTLAISRYAFRVAISQLRAADAAGLQRGGPRPVNANTGRNQVLIPSST